MWALFYFCCPNLLGDRKEYKEKYERQILAGTDKHASDLQKRIGLAVAEELRQKFAPYFLRRLKSEVFPDSEDKQERKLSRKNDLIFIPALSERQEKLYRAFFNSNGAEETVSTGKKVLPALTRKFLIEDGFLDALTAPSRRLSVNNVYKWNPPRALERARVRDIFKFNTVKSNFLEKPQGGRDSAPQGRLQVVESLV